MDSVKSNIQKVLHHQKYSSKLVEKLNKHKQLVLEQNLMIQSALTALIKITFCLTKVHIQVWQNIWKNGSVEVFNKVVMNLYGDKSF